MKIIRPLLLALPVLLTLGCVSVNVHGDPAQATTSTRQSLRIATYNTSLYADTARGLISRLENHDANARKVAAVLQRSRPDIVLLNEFDYDSEQRAADLFQHNYLEVSQPDGGEPLKYAYRYLAPVNSGVPSGLDLDNSGAADPNARSGRERGNDAWGYGLHPGQYGMLVLSRYPIDPKQVRTFQHLRWASMPNAMRPQGPASSKPFYREEVWPHLRLSSKSHWDVPIATPLGTLHLLAAHPTPPVFDGPEDRNGARNHDEIRLWAEYLSPGDKPWLCDDKRVCGGLAADAAFVIVGDYNADPIDGDGKPGVMRQLLDHPRIDASIVPRSEGAAERATQYGLPRKGDLTTHTGDFGPQAGTLRLDYVLPSRNLQVRDSGVFWPLANSPDAAVADASDHHLVWVDLKTEFPL